jgi:hypothetical protein
MEFHVILVKLKNYQILMRVIRSVAVDVMNDRAARQRFPKHECRDHQMLSAMVTWPHMQYFHVAMGINSFAALPTRIERTDVTASTARHAITSTNSSDAVTTGMPAAIMA